MLVYGVQGSCENYRRALAAAGMTSLLTLDTAAPADGLLLPGGGDSSGDTRPDGERRLIERFVSAGRPVLGICRGMQVINVALEGSLIQDLPPESAPFHGGAGHDLVHPIRSAEGSVLRQLYGPVFPVNSFHHQAVGRLGEGLEAVAWAESGFPEAIVHRSLPIWGVQFHPERMSFRRRREDTVDGAPLLCRFLALCRG